MRSKFLRVFSAQRERVGWIYAARDHADERFVFSRLRSRHLFKFEHLGCAILVRNYRLHHRVFVGTCELRGENGENRYTAGRKHTVKDLHHYE